MSRLRYHLTPKQKQAQSYIQFFKKEKKVLVSPNELEREFGAGWNTLPNGKEVIRNYQDMYKKDSALQALKALKKKAA
jgi:hypothetical protein